MWYVYILQNKPRNFIYIGFTRNLRRRIGEHRKGLNQPSKAYRKLKLKAYIVVPTRKKARELEKYLKTGSGKAILKKIEVACNVGSTSPIKIPIIVEILEPNIIGIFA